VKVLDAVGGEDLTKRVLAQAILFEESRRRTQILPIKLLRDLLRHRGEGAQLERKLAKGARRVRARKPNETPAKGPSSTS